MREVQTGKYHNHSKHSIIGQKKEEEMYLFIYFSFFLWDRINAQSSQRLNRFFIFYNCILQTI